MPRGVDGGIADGPMLLSLPAPKSSVASKEETVWMGGGRRCGCWWARRREAEGAGAGGPGELPPVDGVHVVEMRRSDAGGCGGDGCSDCSSGEGVRGSVEDGGKLLSERVASGEVTRGRLVQPATAAAAESSGLVRRRRRAEDGATSSSEPTVERPSALSEEGEVCRRLAAKRDTR